jgi:hypothetical protein
MRETEIVSSAPAKVILAVGAAGVLEREGRKDVLVLIKIKPNQEDTQ